MRCLLLLAPAANRVYAQNAAQLAAAELAICAGLEEVSPVTLGGIDYLAFEGELDAALLRTLGRQSARLALFEQVAAEGGELLRPVELPATDRLDEDFVTIPKYAGKTNEQFTRLLLNVTLAAVDRSEPAADGTGRWSVLDPLCGRGTTLQLAWMYGLDAAGVEGDAKAVEQLAAFYRTWLRRKRLKHTADLVPVRREGKSLGKKFEAAVAPEDAARSEPRLTATVFTGDTRDSAYLFGKRTFDAIVTDAPYGVAHGSRTDVRGVSGKRDRSAAGLLGEAIGVWAGQLKPGGALGISWNTLGLAREDLVELVSGAGLVARDEGHWRRFAHRVDSSINRDLLVATKARPAA